jgi:3-mercaptopyruvate sulfurtransferase SseA
MQRKISYFIALIAMVMTIVAVWHLNRPFEPKQATWEDVLAEARVGGYRIITTQDLRDRYMTDPSTLLLVDTRQEWEFRSAHIKGALNFPMAPTWWERWKKADELEAFLGPEKEKEIVFY